MKTRIIIIDIITFICLPVWADDEMKDIMISGGKISTSLFNSQEKFWNYSYIMKTLYGTKEELGITITYQFTEWISTDAIIINGDIKGKVNHGIGLNITPIKGIHLRVYSGLNSCGEKDKITSIYLAALFAYKCENFTLGAEYNHILNSKYTFGNDFFGCSIFASLKITKYADAYVRFDYLYLKEKEKLFENEKSAVIGFEFKITENLKITPNFKMTFTENNQNPKNYLAYLNCTYSF